MKKIFVIACLGVTALKAQTPVSRGVLPWDKKEHVFFGAVIGAGTYTLSKMLFPAKTKKGTDLRAARISFLTVAAFGLGKEILDYRKHTRMGCWSNTVLEDCKGDFIATCVGGGAITLIISF